MEVVVTTGAINHAKLQSNHHHQQTNIHFLQAGCPSCRPTNSVKPLKGKYHIPWTCLPQTHLRVFQLCLWPLIAPGYLGGGLSCLSSALWCQYPLFRSRNLCLHVILPPSFNWTVWHWDSAEKLCSIWRACHTDFWRRNIAYLNWIWVLTLS